jgi:hypothetical protein
MFFQEPLDNGSPTVVTEFDIEEPKVISNKAKKKSHSGIKKFNSRIPKKTSTASKRLKLIKKIFLHFVSMYISDDLVVRKSSRQHLGTIRYWEQRLNYVYVDGVATIDKEKPIAGTTYQIFHYITIYQICML